MVFCDVSKLSECIDFIFQLAATCIGVFLGYCGGVILQDRKQKIDEKQKRDRVKESLLLEINLHKELLQRKKIKKRGDRIFVTELPTFSFDGIIASGLYTYLPPELQNIVSRHYQGCHQINSYIKKGIWIVPTPLEEINEMKTILRREIDIVLEKLKELN